jgi:hypothetical protein
VVLNILKSDVHAETQIMRIITRSLFGGCSVRISVGRPITLIDDFREFLSPLSSKSFLIRLSPYHSTLNILWHVDPLLGNDREMSSYTTAVDRLWPQETRMQQLSCWRRR